MAAQVVNSFAIKSISSMYLNPEYADVHFTFPNDDHTEEVPAHRNILATVSPVFSRMFYGPLKEGDTVKIDDSNAGAFKEFLQIIYLPEIKLSTKNFEEVIRLADKYDMVGSLGACIEYLESQVTSENAVMVYQLAISHENVKLRQFCETIIMISTKDVLKSDAFLQCEQNVVEQILQMDKLECNEIELFVACMKWAAFSCQKIGVDEKNSKNLKNQLGNCFRLIRFGAMDEKSVCEILANEIYMDLFTRDELADFFRTKMDRNFQSVIFGNTMRTRPMKTELNCQRNFLTGTCYLKIRESVWFSTNELVQLKGVSFGSIKPYLSPYLSFYSDVEFIEYDTNTFNTNAPSRTLATTNCSIGSECGLLLSSPISINPLMMYEIRVVDVPTGFYYYHNNGSTPVMANEIKLNDKITIKFHHDPSDNDSARRHLVSKLTFLTLG